MRRHGFGPYSKSKTWVGVALLLLVGGLGVFLGRGRTSSRAAVASSSAPAEAHAPFRPARIATEGRADPASDPEHQRGQKATDLRLDGSPAVPSKSQELKPTGVTYRQVEGVMADHFPLLREPPPGMERNFQAYSRDAHEMIYLDGDRNNLSVARLTLSYRLSASPEKLQTQADLVSRFVEAAFPEDKTTVTWVSKAIGEVEKEAGLAASRSIAVGEKLLRVMLFANMGELNVSVMHVDDYD